MIRFNAYWRTYSRVLTFTDGPGACRQVEVNLTPIPCCYSSSWENDVAPIRIRAHCTARHEGDLGMKEPPPEVLAEMKAHLGDDLVHRLLTEDFLSQIDWDKYESVRNGGANLQDILKTV